MSSKLKIKTPADIYPLKVNNRNTKTRCEICSKLTLKTPERRHWSRSTVFTVNFEHVIASWVKTLAVLFFFGNFANIHHINVVFLFVTLSKCLPAQETLNCSKLTIGTVEKCQKEK